jgi:hypothetical protein
MEMSVHPQSTKWGFIRENEECLKNFCNLIKRICNGNECYIWIQDEIPNGKVGRGEEH